MNKEQPSIDERYVALSIKRSEAAARVGAVREAAMYVMYAVGFASQLLTLGTLPSMIQAVSVTGFFILLISSALLHRMVFDFYSKMIDSIFQGYNGLSVDYVKDQNARIQRFTQLTRTVNTAWFVFFVVIVSVFLLQ